MPSWFYIVITLLLCFQYISAVPTFQEIDNPNLRRRDPALATSPSGGYVPVHIDCPQNPFVRSPFDKDNGHAQLGRGESTYIKEKAAQSIPLWQKYLENVRLEKFKIDEFLKPAKEKGGVAALTLPNIGFAVSGGSVRALLYGTSILDSFDSRNDKANEAKVGGILQLANYAVGVSGASWLIGGWATSNFPVLSTLVPTWRLSQDNELWKWNVAKHYGSHHKMVKKKHKAGFPVSLVENEPGKKKQQIGKAVLWSSIREGSLYKKREAPFVMAVATSRPDKGKPFTPESPTYEFSAEEFGLYHPYLNVSIPIEHLGSTYTATRPESQRCVAGFDNAGFIMGMSSNIFSVGDAPKEDKKPKYIRVAQKFVHDHTDFEGKVPNPFKGLGKKSDPSGGDFQDTDRDLILMADSGLIEENIPIRPLIQPERKLDVVFALDSSAAGQDPRDPSLYRYPNGAQLYGIYSKTKLPVYGGYHMPNIPNASDGTFTKLGYTKRPTFFGCDDLRGPLIIYMPNYHATEDTNAATEKLTFKLLKMLDQHRIRTGQFAWHVPW
ncbi:hypothetical protein PCANC_09197 [Puccinia coronata f. sp. avenae]|uniref:Lysophospholipase n=1 Tax=Puccinia coronata f. sp. avenae TaxID=200324 RepID=A0A2N5SZE5_9BASI|nr:hypothetical protein PCANC_09197 [Puccinia coronata f. sp. avenae]